MNGSANEQRSRVSHIAFEQLPHENRVSQLDMSQQLEHVTTFHHASAEAAHPPAEGPPSQ